MNQALLQLLSMTNIPSQVIDSDDYDVDVSDEGKPRISLGPGKMADDDIYVLKVTLHRTKPAIYRRVEVKANTTFEDLHYIIQNVMGWYCCHLHGFEVSTTPAPQNQYRGKIYIQKRDEYDDIDNFDKRDETEVISNYLKMDGLKTITYTYDFGDCWEHKIHLEKVIKANPKYTYPRCTGGKMKCPPEDCGSISGFYEEFLPKMMDKNHPEHKETADWYGEETFDPKDFNYKNVDLSTLESDKKFDKKMRMGFF